jgi:ABC-type nickel/cobalt efflux system permease component RcnA
MPQLRTYSTTFLAKIALTRQVADLHGSSHFTSCEPSPPRLTLAGTFIMRLKPMLALTAFTIIITVMPIKKFLFIFQNKQYFFYRRRRRRRRRRHQYISSSSSYHHHHHHHHHHHYHYHYQYHYHYYCYYCY